MRVQITIDSGEMPALRKAMERVGASVHDSNFVMNGSRVASFEHRKYGQRVIEFEIPRVDGRTCSDLLDRLNVELKDLIVDTSDPDEF